MAAPHGDRRGRPLQGEPAERDARPRCARRSAISATSTGRPRPTPTRPTSRCSTCRGSGRSAPSASASARRRRRRRQRRDGPLRDHALALERTFFERVRLSITIAAVRLDGGSFDVPSLFGLDRRSPATLTVTVPPGTSAGTYDVTVVGDEQGRTSTRPTAHVVVETDTPDGAAAVDAHPDAARRSAARASPTSIGWPRRHRPHERDRRRTSSSASVDGGAWTTIATHERRHPVARRARQTFEPRLPLPRPGPRRGRELERRGRRRATFDRRSSSRTGASAVSYSGHVAQVRVLGRLRAAPTTYATSAGARVRTTFTGRGIAVVGPDEPDPRQREGLRRRRLHGHDQLPGRDGD